MKIVCIYCVDLVLNLIGVLAELRTFDSKIGAVVEITGESYFITTNADYIPMPPIRPDHSIYVRADYRWGDDDPTLWPQNYSASLCHLGAIHRPITDKKRNLWIMWWNPTPDDFIPFEKGKTLTRNLGRLSGSRLAELLKPITALLDEYADYECTFQSPAKPLAFFPLLIQHIQLGRDRLQSLPSTYEKMVVGVTQLQRHVLELHGLLRYMKVYKPRMEDPKYVAAFVEKCMGVFTLDPHIAQQFGAAGLPFWLMRPTYSFTDENILEVVVPVDPATQLELQPAAQLPAIKTGASTHAKMMAMQQTWQSTSWYLDPFDAQPSVPRDGDAAPIAPPAPVPAPVAGPSSRDFHQVNRAGTQRGARKWLSSPLRPNPL